MSDTGVGGVVSVLVAKPVGQLAEGDDPDEDEADAEHDENRLAALLGGRLTEETQRGE